jgi:hypothetical protein
MDARFAESWFNADHRVLGRWLHPFCLEDALILSVAESPFILAVDSRINYSLADLQLAVHICSRPASVFTCAQFTQSWWARLLTAIRSLRCRTEVGLRIECQRFVNYIDDYYATPGVWHGEGGQSLNAPWILGTVTFLISHTTFRPREVWTMPIGQAFWIAAVLEEQMSPEVQIVSEEESAAMREMGISL